MKITVKFVILAAMFSAASAAPLEPIDCVKVSSTVKQLVTANPSAVLEIVSSQVAANSSCACEVVKAAIVASEASPELVASIVDTVILESPESKDLVSQCAVAIAPDAVTEVQKVMAKYDAAEGDMGYSEKGGMEKGGMAKGGLATDPIPEPLALGNVLDFPIGNSPASNTVGPTIGGPGGYPLLPATLPPYFPPIPGGQEGGQDPDIPVVTSP